MATRTDRPATAPPSAPGAARRTPWWGWLLRALPAIAFLATFGFFFFDKSDSAREVFKSGRGLLTVGVIVVGYVVLAVLLRRFVRWSWVAPLALTAVVLGLAAWIVRPYYVDETDNTRLVDADTEIRDASEVDGQAPAPPASGGAPAPPPAPAGPVRVAAGPLQGLAGHDASGTVEVIQDTDGSYIVRFAGFDIEGTPAPVVYVLDGSDQRNPGGANLGALKGNVGEASDYEVPDGTQPGAGWTVLVWCESFSVEIANATLSAV